ncbi:MAG: hypothetical protein AAF943_00820 [Pseudomonadota bacterium]
MVSALRQLGLAHAAVATGPKSLLVAINAAEAVGGQSETFEAAIRVEGLAEGEAAYLTLAAVDVGILNLTGFEAPDPTGHYFGQRRLGIEMRDISGRLINGFNGALGEVRSGGDLSAGLSRLSPPPREALMAFFRGPVQVGTDGRAVIKVAKPNFNGTIKLMAVAWSATLAAGPLARLDLPGLLQQLDRYPYGCTEQVTSGALLLLYLGQVAAQAGLGAPEEIDAKVNEAIARVLNRQTSNGAFGLWRAQTGAFWLDAYVADFLSRARAQGYAVPNRAFALALDNLRNRVNYAPDFDRGGEDIAYALLVLAREGSAAVGDLRYYAETKAEAFRRSTAVAQLAAAPAFYGDQLCADALFRRAAQRLTATSQDRGWRENFGTPRWDAAAVLKLSAEVGSSALDPAPLLASIQRSARLSTQEATQMALAAHALAAPEASPVVAVDGTPRPEALIKRLRDTDAGGR